MTPVDRGEPDEPISSGPGSQGSTSEDAISVERCCSAPICAAAISGART